MKTEVDPGAGKSWGELVGDKIVTDFCNRLVGVHLTPTQALAITRQVALCTNPPIKPKAAEIKVLNSTRRIKE